MSYTNAERERLTLDAIDAVEAVDGGDWTPADLIELQGPDAVAGLVLYVNLLETMLYLTRGADVPKVRESARVTASAWRKAPQ